MFINVCGIKQILVCPDFIELILKYDVCIFVETKLDDIDSLTIPKNYQYFSKIRKRCKTKSCGIVIIYKSELHKYLHFYKTECEFVQWVKFSKDIVCKNIGTLNNLHLCPYLMMLANGTIFLR